MPDLKAIRGGKPKEMAEARILRCPKCGGTRVHEDRVGVAVDKKNRVVHRGTLVRYCVKCDVEVL